MERESCLYKSYTKKKPLELFFTLEESLSTNPLISVIMPVHNGENYIKSSILSVVNQSYSNWEMYIVNDGSTDKTLEIIKEAEKSEPRIKNINLDKCSEGPARPRNIGLKESKGNYIAFLDADDLWDVTKLERQIKEIQDYGCDIVSSNARIINDSNETLKILNKTRLFNFLRIFFNSFNSLLISNPIILSSSLIKNNSNLKFREDLSLSAIEDWGYWIDSAYNGSELKISNEIYCSYRKHPEAATIKKGINQYYKIFVLFSLLLVEGKIGIIKYIIVSSLCYLKLLKKTLQRE